MVWLSIALVGACALCWDIAIVLQKQAADALPPLVPGKGLGATVLRFARSPRWLGGAAISLLGWALFTGALTFTPVSVARSIQGLGFVALAGMSVWFLNHRLSVREWLGVAGVTGGVALLGLSEPAVPSPPAPFEAWHLGAGVALALGACGAIWLWRRSAPGRLSGPVASGVIAGLLLGIGDVLTRAVIVELQASARVAVALLAPALVAAYLLGVAVLTRGYQQGRALVVTGMADFAARVVTLALGVFAMGEALPEEPLLRAGRLAGFAAILSGTVALAHLSAKAGDFPSSWAQSG